MDKLIRKAKKFINNIIITLTKLSEIDEEIYYDPEEYTPYSVTVTNPRNNKSITFKLLVLNLFVRRRTGKVRMLRNYDFLMELMFDYIYKINDNPDIRNKLSSIFNDEEISLLVNYYKDSYKPKSKVTHLGNIPDY